MENYMDDKIVIGGYIVSDIMMLDDDTCAMYFKTVYVSIPDREKYNYNDLMIFKNGVLQDKKNGEEGVLMANKVSFFIDSLNSSVNLIKKRILWIDKSLAPNVSFDVIKCLI